MKNEESIKSFLKKPQTSRLLDFYKTLCVEKEDDRWDILIVVTRKGFWMYKILTDNYQIKANVNEPYEYSDRYLTKALDRKFFEGKRVCLVDDTLTRGYSLFRNYCILKRYGAKSVSPYVYAVSTEFPKLGRQNVDQMQDIVEEVYKRTPVLVEDGFPNMYEEFAQRTRGFRYMTPDNISRLCLAETELFQQLLCPMVVNLPMMVNKPDGKIMTDEIVMDKSRFYQFTQENDEWKFVPNRYVSGDPMDPLHEIKGYLDCDIECSYLVYSNPLVERLKKSFLHSMIVKCKYNITEDGMYHMALVPFAIVRSMEKKQLQRLFDTLLEGTDYKEELNRKLEEDEKDAFAWTAMVRAVISCLSIYVGEKCKEYLKEIGITQVYYDEDIMKYNSEPLFRETIDDVISKNAISKWTEKLSEISLKERDRIEVPLGENAPLMTDVYNTVHNLVIGRNEKDASEKSGDWISIDEIENSLIEKKYRFASYDEFERCTTSIILAMLEISVFGNYLKITDTEIIQRGFRHGENSQLLLPEGGRYCYICAEALYIMAREQYSSKKLKNFLDGTEEYLFASGILSGDHIQESFESYVKWFDNHKDDAKYYIMGKEFIFDRLSKQEEKVHDYAVWLAEKYANGPQGG